MATTETPARKGILHSCRIQQSFPNATLVHFPEPISIRLGSERGYRLFFEPLDTLPHLLVAHDVRPGRTLVVTDTHVAEHYRGRLEQALVEAGWTPRTLILPPGETTKSNEHLQAIYDAALAWGIDRHTPVLALGGGVVGDLAGFAAATLLRGLPLVQIPTTLIAQVDSAIGGKTGINHDVGKNLIGAFHQPLFVCIDRSTLQTLPEREWTSGLAEVVKHALIADRALVARLEAEWQAVLDRSDTVVPEVIHRAAAIKASVVSEDEREAGRRAILNFGHTFGHAIERVAGYGTFTHGEAVALGMRAALYLSHVRHPELPLERADRLVQQIPVPPGLGELATTDLMDAMQADKKARAGSLRFVVLRSIGEAYVTGDVSTADVEAAWAFAGGT